MSIVAGIAALAIAPGSPELVAALMEVPALFGPLLFVEGLGYGLNSVGVLAWSPLAPMAETVVGVTAMLGELPLFLWLLAKGASTPPASIHACPVSRWLRAPRPTPFEQISLLRHDLTQIARER